jgi:asparagine synthase (glutamine-hydrolysing)
VLLSPRAHQRGYFKREVVERMAREHASLAADHGSMLWALLHLELWHRTWVDAAPETNVA